jgi:hypothetical protein
MLCQPQLLQSKTYPCLRQAIASVIRLALSDGFVGKIEAIAEKFCILLAG